MVRTIKTKKEFEEIWNHSTKYSSIAVFFHDYMLNSLKESKAFRQLKTIIKQVEDDGYNLLYYCEDETIKGSTGKWLYFAIDSEITHETKIVVKRISGAMGELRDNEEIKETCYKDIPMSPAGFGYGPTGTASCCPYFG